MTINYRWERINRLLKELEYEVVRGCMDGEIDENVLYQFFVPVSKSIPHGVVFCEFRTRPVLGQHYLFDCETSTLRIVK